MLCMLLTDSRDEFAASARPFGPAAGRPGVAAGGQVIDHPRDAEAATAVAETVRDRLRERGIDPHRSPAEAERIATEEVRAWDDRALALGNLALADAASCVRRVIALVSGYGALQPFLDDPDVEELWINAPDRVFIARRGVSERVDVRLEAGEVRELVERMLHAAGRRVDMSQPFVDASLADGSRLHVVIPEISRAHWAVNIRRFHKRYRSLAALVAGGTVPPAQADLLVDAMRAGASVLVSGATHSGKTTVLGALLGVLAPTTRVVTIEETFELSVDLPDVVALQGRPPSLEGTGEVTLRRLVKESLRMRPDRLVIGEVRDAEALDLVLALNTGVPAGVTIHANSASEALQKLAALPLLAGRNIDHDFLVPSIARSIDLVVHCELGADGQRHIAEIVAPTGRVSDGDVETRAVYRHGQETAE